MKYSRKSRHERGYNYQWQKARKLYLQMQPMCVLCRDMGILTAATVVDHIKPHRGNRDLFWDQENWQSLCKPCHDGAKQQSEHTGIVRGAGEDGMPTCRNHPWNKPMARPTVVLPGDYFLKNY